MQNSNICISFDPLLKLNRWNESTHNRNQKQISMCLWTYSKIHQALIYFCLFLLSVQLIVTEQIGLESCLDIFYVKKIFWEKFKSSHKLFSSSEICDFKNDFWTLKKLGPNDSAQCALFWALLALDLHFLRIPDLFSWLPLGQSVHNLYKPN